MGLRIYQNIMAMNAHRNLQSTDRALGKSLERLATGLRINRAADDAAGLAISEKIRGQVKGLMRASSNAQDAISMIQTAEGALTETHSIMQRMRELSVQAANGTLTSNDREQIQLEVDQLVSEVDRIAHNTEFNTKKLLDGTATAVITTNDLQTKAFIIGDVGKGGNFSLQKDVVDVGQQQILKSKQWIVEEDLDLLGNVVADETIDSVALPGNQVSTYASVSQPTGSTLNLNLVTETFTIEALTDGAVALADAGTNFAVYGNVAESTLLKRTATDSTDANWADYAATDNFTATIGGQAIDFQLGAASGETLGGAIYLANQDLSGTGISLSINNNNTGVKVINNTGAAISVTAANSFFQQLGLASADADLQNIAASDSVSGTVISYVAVSANGSLMRGDLAEGEQIDTNIDLDLSLSATFEATETATFNATTRTYISADASHELGNITAFRDANGVSLFSEQTITMRANNLSTSFTISASDTVQNFADKIFTAIGTGLDMAKYWAGSKDPQLVNINNAATTDDYWDDPDNDGLAPDGTDRSLFELPGTMYISSAMVGELGDLSFSADEQILNALGIVEVQESINPVYDITVSNLHTGAVVNTATTSEYRVSNLIDGLIVEYDPMADITMNVDASSNDLPPATAASDEPPTFSANAADEFEYIHVAPTGVRFHIGANEGQILDSYISELTSGSLGISNLDLTSQSAAEESISLLDDAINTVSAERARLGAYQNRMEHTINNLGVAAENLASAESRIRDLDFAKEMIDFTRNQILMQSGTAMLAQANMLPQSVLQIIG